MEGEELQGLDLLDMFLEALFQKIERTCKIDHPPEGHTEEEISVMMNTVCNEGRESGGEEETGCGSTLTSALLKEQNVHSKGRLNVRCCTGSECLGNDFGSELGADSYSLAYSDSDTMDNETTLVENKAVVTGGNTVASSSVSGSVSDSVSDMSSSFVTSQKKKDPR